jgi:hypothetical protein
MPTFLLKLAAVLAAAPVPLGEAPQQPVPIGAGKAYHPGATSAAVARSEPVGRLRCSRTPVRRVGIHLELFAARRAVVIPPGIGIAPPFARDGAYVRGGRCSYPLRTVNPTGVFEIRPGIELTLGDLFAVWGQPLGRNQLAAFRARRGERVRAWVGGRAWRGRLSAIPLRRHAQIVLEVGGFVPPHPRYLFPRGL